MMFSKERGNTTAWVLLALAAILVVAGFYFWLTREVEGSGNPPVLTAEPSVIDGDEVWLEPVAGLMKAIFEPEKMVDEPVAGLATIDALVGDRGLWLADPAGARLLALLPEGEPQRQFESGQQVQVKGIVRELGPPNEIELDRLEPETVTQLAEKQTYLQVDELAVVSTAAAEVSEVTKTESAGAAAVMADPGGFVGKKVSFTGHVLDADTDRGFWLRAGDDRLFALLSQELDVPEYQTDIDDGDTVEVEGTIMEARRASQLSEVDPVWAEADRILAREEVFLKVDRAEVR